MAEIVAHYGHISILKLAFDKAIIDAEMITKAANKGKYTHIINYMLGKQCEFQH